MRRALALLNTQKKQRKVGVYDRNGRLVQELALPPAEGAAAAGTSCSCLQLQVSARVCAAYVCVSPNTQFME